MKNLKKIAVTIVLLLIALACEKGDELRNLQQLDDSPVFMDLPMLRDHTNARTADSKYTLYSAEYLTAEESGQVGRTIFFRNVGNKQLGSDFVPGLGLDGTDNISFYIDENRPSNDLAVGVTSNAITRAMQTWDGVTCTELGMYQVPSQPGTSTGFVSALLGFGGSFDYTADVVHAGWLPASFFDILTSQGGTFILGVTFTLIFIDENGNLTDLDNNGKADVAWREIYYNDNFRWRDGARYDVETVALHEAGHGLSQAHFGTAFLDSGGHQLHFSPRAVMNAAYSGVQRVISETDNAGHCSNWSGWPNN